LPTTHASLSNPSSSSQSSSIVPNDFTHLVTPHLPAAYRLARWLTGNPDDAEDLLQEATLRAFRHFDQFRGGDAHSWLLTIVRHTCYTWHKRLRRLPLDQVATLDVEDPDAPCPERLLLQRLTTRCVDEAIAGLPESFRQVFVLRELEGLSYGEIAEALQMPVGTVMSRLSRARVRFRRAANVNCRA